MSPTPGVCFQGNKQNIYPIVWHEHEIESINCTGVKKWVIASDKSGKAPAIFLVYQWIVFN